MRYAKLVDAILADGYSLGHFAEVCGIEEDYFTQMLGTDEDFTPDEFWAIAMGLGIAGSAEAQDALFFCG